MSPKQTFDTLADLLADKPARITYYDLESITSLPEFVRLFEDCLSFDDTGLTMQRRG